MGIIISDRQKNIKISKAGIRAVCAEVLRALKFPADSVVDITFVTAGAIRSLNKRYFKKDSETDVIALGYKKSDDKYLGDIIINPGAAIKNSKVYRTAPRQELYLYVIHGMLHLAGYSDLTAADKRRMSNKEKEILARL